MSKRKGRAASLGGPRLDAGLIDRAGDDVVGSHGKRRRRGVRGGDAAGRSDPQRSIVVALARDAEAAGDELSLVSTQMLRKALGQPDTEDDDAAPAPIERSFNPYDSG